MNSSQKWRLNYLIIAAIGICIAFTLILYALKQNINVFFTPSQLAEAKGQLNQARLGGVVKKGSVQREQNALGVNFIVTDFHREIQVHYQGILPDLFKEGKGVIAEGLVNAQGIFMANTVLAKHDENYMPKNVAIAVNQGRSQINEEQT